MSSPYMFRWEANRWFNASCDTTDNREVALKRVKLQRDIFLEMKLAGDPTYCCFTKNEVRELFFTQPFGSLPRRTHVAYDCDTQNDGTVEQLFLGKATGNICLWEQGSTINWIARRDGYPLSRHALRVVRAAFWAARQWNKVMDGRVVFRYVDRFDDACFMVEYGGDRSDVFAKSFFPDDWERNLNTLRLFGKCFERGEIGRLRNVMLHELGHVLGMRHGHAHDGVEGFLPPEDIANGPESVVWGARNPKSVMSYHKGQCIQSSDVEHMRRAYDELLDGMVIAGKGRFRLVKKVVKRVEPNN